MSVIKQGLFQPGEEKAQEYSINIFKYLMVGNEDEGARISSLVPSDWTKSNGYKKKIWTQEGTFCIVEVVKH